MLKKIAALVQGQGHCVLATCGPVAAGRVGDPGGLLVGCVPHTSLMSCCASADCREFWLATLTDTRKFRNLLANPRASLLFDDRAGDRAGDAGPNLALTVETERAPFASEQDAAQARLALLARHPQLASFLAGEGVVLLRLKALRFQLLTGPTDVFVADAEKMLDAGRGKA